MTDIFERKDFFDLTSNDRALMKSFSLYLLRNIKETKYGCSLLNDSENALLDEYQIDIVPGREDLDRIYKVVCEKGGLLNSVPAMLACGYALDENENNRFNNLKARVLQIVIYYHDKGVKSYRVNTLIRRIRLLLKPKFKWLLRLVLVDHKGHEDIIFLSRRGKQLTRVMIFTIIKQFSNLFKLCGCERIIGWLALTSF